MRRTVERIEIEGEKVLLYRGGDPPVLERQVSLQDFLREVAVATRRPGRGNHLLLPPGARIVKVDGTATVCCIEQPPQVRLIRWSAAQMGKGGEYETYRLAFPYIVYLFLFFQASFEDMRVYYRTAPVQSPTDALLIPNLWNVQADPSKPSACRACLRGRPEDLRERPLVEQMTMLLDFFWNTGFNIDITGNCFERAKTLDTRIASLKAWEAARWNRDCVLHRAASPGAAHPLERRPNGKGGRVRDVPSRLSLYRLSFSLLPGKLRGYARLLPDRAGSESD